MLNGTLNSGPDGTTIRCSASRILRWTGPNSVRKASWPSLRSKARTNSVSSIVTRMSRTSSSARWTLSTIS